MTTNKLKTMRDVFLEQVYNRMHEEEHIFFLTADFGAPTLDKIREENRNLQNEIVSLTYKNKELHKEIQKLKQKEQQ